MKILCHVGPWCRGQFREIARGLDRAGSVRFVSGFRALDETGLVSAYYAYVRDGLGAASSLGDDDHEVVVRCRLLRTLNAETARVHVTAMRRAIREMLEREGPDAIICESIDQYLHDLLFQEARALGIPAYGLIRSFVNGYFRVSERGEYVPARQPDDKEVEQVLRQLMDAQYLPQNLHALKRSPRLTYLRIQLSNLLRVGYFAAVRWLKREPYNYHYWASSRCAWTYSAHLIPRLSIGDPAWRSLVATSGKPVIYVPLQHYPEATVDYWADDLPMVNYPEALCQLLERLRHKFHVLVKEHPGVQGFRKPSFYRDIERLGVTICPTNERSQDCIAVSDAVLVWTGSAGFEAALRGKAVLTTCTPYYASGDRFLKVGIDTDTDLIGRFIAHCQTVPLSSEARADMVKHLLAGGYPGRFQNDGSFSIDRAEDVAAARAVGEALIELHGTVAAAQ